MDPPVAPQMTVKMKFKLLSEIKDKLTQERLAIFRQTCFGRWLDLTDDTSVPLLLYNLLQMEMNPPPPGSRDDEIFFEIGPYRRRFGRADFCLLTGLPFGPAPELDLVLDGLCMTLFGSHTPKVGHVYNMFKNDIKGPNDDTADNYGDEDVVRLCLILMVERFFVGHELKTRIDIRLSRAVNDLGIFANYPWGIYIWEYTVRQMRNCIGRRDGNGALSVFGLLYALKIWILETFLWSTEFYSKDITVYPRAFRWTKLAQPKQIKAQHVRTILDVSSVPPLPRLVPDHFEASLDWYRNNMDFIGEVQEAHHQDQQPAHQPGFQPGYQPGFQQWQEHYNPILDSLQGWRPTVDTQLHVLAEWRQTVDTEMATYRQHWQGQMPSHAPPQPRPQAPPQPAPQAPPRDFRFQDMLNLGDPTYFDFDFDTPTDQTTRMPSSSGTYMASPSGTYMASPSGTYMPSPCTSYGMATTAMTESMAGMSMSMPSGGPSMQHASEAFQTPVVDQRPAREIIPGPHCRYPFTTQGATTPLPERPRERVAREEPADVVLALKRGFHHVSIQYLPGELLNKEWWHILLGKGQNKHYLYTKRG